jgi:hypothetical protein
MIQHYLSLGSFGLVWFGSQAIDTCTCSVDLISTNNATLPPLQVATSISYCTGVELLIQYYNTMLAVSNVSGGSSTLAI